MEYNTLCNTPSDIYEHLPTLRAYASECESAIEMGVRNCVSSWALALGLLENGKEKKVLIVNDINVCNTSKLESCLETTPLQLHKVWESNLNGTIRTPVDLCFIDTWHVYGQLKRELAYYAPLTKKYIIMHDTTVDEWDGETVRNIHKYDPDEQSRQSGFPKEEILKGLWPAIEEFLAANPEWSLHQRWTNNNGLTILKRMN